MPELAENGLGAVFHLSAFDMLLSVVRFSMSTTTHQDYDPQSVCLHLAVFSLFPQPQFWLSLYDLHQTGRQDRTLFFPTADASVQIFYD